MKISNQPLTFVRPTERPETAEPPTTAIPTEAIPQGYTGPTIVTKEKAQQILMAQQNKSSAAMTSAIRQSELNEQLKPTDQRLNTKGDQFIGNSKKIALSGVPLPGWDAKSIEASNRDELSKILEGDHKDPSGQKNYLDALKDSNSQNDDQLMKDIDPTKQKNSFEGGSKLGNKVRDELAAKGLNGAYGDRVGGGSNPKVEHGKDNGTRVGPDVSTLSPAFEPGKQPWDFKTSTEATAAISADDSTLYREVYNKNGVQVVVTPNRGRDIQGGSDRTQGGTATGWLPIPGKNEDIFINNSDGNFYKWVSVKDNDQNRVTILLPKDGQKDPTILVGNAKDGLKSAQQPKGDDRIRVAQKPQEEKKETKPQGPKKMDADYKDGLHGDVDYADLIAYRQNGPSDPLEPTTGKTEVQIGRLAEGIAIGIMSKINPKPNDGGGATGPIVIGGNPIADPLEPPVPKRTNIKPRKPDGPVGPGGVPVILGSGGVQEIDSDDNQLP